MAEIIQEQKDSSQSLYYALAEQNIALFSRLHTFPVEAFFSFVSERQDYIHKQQEAINKQKRRP